MKSEQNRMGDMRGGVKPGEDGPPSPPALDGGPGKDQQRDDAAVREFFQHGLEGGQVLGESSHGPPAHRWGLDVLEDSVPRRGLREGWGCTTRVGRWLRCNEVTMRGSCACSRNRLEP